MAATGIATVDDGHGVYFAVTVLATQRSVAEVTVLIGRAVRIVEALAARVRCPLTCPGDAEVIDRARVGVVTRDPRQRQRRAPLAIVTRVLRAWVVVITPILQTGTGAV